MIWKQLAWASAAAVLAACGGGDGASSDSSNHDYDEQVREQYVLACRADGFEEAECMRQLECVESQIAFEDYVRLDNDRAAGQEVPELSAALEECVKG